MRTFVFSCTKFTVLVDCDEANSITNTAPITQKFCGQPIKNLADYMRRIGGFEYKELKRLTVPSANGVQECPIRSESSAVHMTEKSGP